MKVLVSVTLSAVSIVSTAGEFDLRNPSAKSRVSFVEVDQKSQPQIYRIDEKKLSRDGKRFIAIGPFKSSGELSVTDDNCPANLVGGKTCGKDTGRTFGIFLQANYKDDSGEQSREFRYALGAQLFTKPSGPSSLGADGKINAHVQSLEQDRVSAQMVKFEDGYYVIAGVGAEVLTSQSSIARQMQAAWHSNSLTNTKKGAFVYDDSLGTDLSGSVEGAIGTSRRLSYGNVVMTLIPQIGASVSSKSQNTQVNASVDLGLSRKAESVHVYGKGAYAVSGEKESVYGIRGESCISDRACVFVAVESRKDYLDRLFKGGTKQFVGGVRLRDSKSEQNSQVGSVR